MKSVITEAKYTKRFNTGEYQYEEITLVAAVDPKESGVVVLTEMKTQINEAFTGEAAGDDEQETKTAKAGKGKKNGKGKSNSSNDEDEDEQDSDEETGTDEDEGSDDDEASDDEDGDDSDDSSDDSESEEDSEEDSDEGSSKSSKKGKSSKGAKSSKAGKAEGGKKFKKKPQNYDRGIEQHKDIFSKVLGLVSPDWKKTDASVAKAKKVSESMEGKSFLDANGEVIAEFKAEVKKLMAAKKKK